MPVSQSPATYLKNGLSCFDVKSYGAACDATAAGSGTDDTAAIQAAVTAAAAVNGVVVIPARSKVTSAITASGSVTICGPGCAPDDGSGALGYAPRGQLITTSTTGDVIAITGNSSTVGAHIHDLGINCTTAYTSGSHTAGAGIRLTNCIGSVIERVTVFNKYDGIVADGNGTSWFLKVRDCEIALFKHRGFSAEMSVFGHGFLLLNGCQITNAGGTQATDSGVYLANCTPYVNNCEVLGAAYGVTLTSRTEYGYFSEVLADNCSNGWLLSGTSVLANTFQSCYAAGIGGTTGVTITGAKLTQWRGGQMIYWSTGFSIDSTAKDTHITDCQFNAGGGVAFSGVPFSLASGAKDIQILNNYAPRGSGSITLGGSHTYTYIAGNTGMGITGTTTGTGNSITAGPY